MGRRRCAIALAAMVRAGAHGNADAGSTGVPARVHRVAASSARAHEQGRSRDRAANTMTMAPAVLDRRPAPRAHVVRVQRRQLPVYSPLPLGAVRGTARRVFGSREDLRPRVREMLRALYAAEGVVLMGAGTQALQVAIHTARRLVGGPLTVALPAFTCFDVASAAVAAGARITPSHLAPAPLATDLDSTT